MTLEPIDDPNLKTGAIYTKPPIPAVYGAIRDVQHDISQVGLAKDQKNNHQRYMFRGIDGLYNLIAPILAKHGLVILPRVTKRDEATIKTKSGTATRVVLEVEYDLIAASDGSKHTVSSHGEAFDTADKAVNKALIAAYKYMCFQVFAIPVEGTPDADSEHHQQVGDSEDMPPRSQPQQQQSRSEPRQGPSKVLSQPQDALADEWARLCKAKLHNQGIDALSCILNLSIEEVREYGKAQGMAFIPQQMSGAVLEAFREIQA